MKSEILVKKWKSDKKFLLANSSSDNEIKDILKKEYPKRNTLKSN